MNRAKYLTKNTLIFAIGNLGSKLINFFLIPLFTNALTTKEYGVTDLIFTICSVAMPVIVLNINEAIMRFSIDKDADLNKTMSVGIFVSLLSILLAIPLYGVTWLYPTISKYRVYVYIYAITYGVSEINVFYLRGKEKLLAFSISSILKTLFVAGFNILFLIVFHWGIEGFLLAYIVSNILTALYAFFAGNVVDVIKHFSFDKELFKRMAAYSIPLIPNSFMWWIIDSSDRIMITAFIGVGISGIYAVSSKITGLISFVSTIFNQAYSYSAIHEDNSEDRVEFNNKVLDMLFLMVTFVGVSVLTIIKPFIRVYVESSFFDAWVYSPPLIVGTSILVLATFFSVFYTVNKDSIGFLKSGITGAAVNIVLNLILIPIIGVLGAAVATLMSYLAIFVFRYFDIRKYIHLDVFNVQHIVSLILLFVSGVSVYSNISIQVILFFASALLLIMLYKSTIRILCTKGMGIIKSMIKK